MKTVFDQVNALLDSANAALGEIDWHAQRIGEYSLGFPTPTKALIARKLIKTQELVDNLKEKASK